MADEADQQLDGGDLMGGRYGGNIGRKSRTRRATHQEVKEAAWGTRGSPKPVSIRLGKAGVWVEEPKA